MSIKLSDNLLAKAVNLDSMTIDSPTERTNNDGVAIRPTVYFTNGKVDENGKAKPTKDSKLYTPNADEASAIENCTKDIVETVSIDGSKFRFLKSTLNDDELKEIKSVKGMVAAEQSINMLDTVVKKLTGAYVMALTDEQRKMVAERAAAMLISATDKMTSVQVKRAGKAKIRLF